MADNAEIVYYNFLSYYNIKTFSGYQLVQLMVYCNIQILKLIIQDSLHCLTIQQFLVAWELILE